MESRIAMVPGLRGVLVLLLLSVGVGTANAVPSFARQTGQQCAACHVSWPELTPYGRFFKATGYTIGKPFWSSDKPASTTFPRR